MPHAVRQISTTSPTVYAFEIDGKVSAAEMKAMGETMNEAFDRHQEVNMLLIFRRFEGSEMGASMNWDAMTSQVRSVAKVGRYVTVGAPDSAKAMIEAMGKIIPVEAKTFDMHELDLAWSYVGARPA
ncbi:STAS/SEC14 domain-containing protein [Jannaschia formosa]|uniref:STAS/SEC14 domain-containing protein n=1 Tax=Jannaschia formosa TaxID=2259592 RepID=UPI000E1BB459|nr:STAS/SEC14 domain-containing protein [Jannaschia formosa]TFL17679.1 STAS/SEC14 domain-containing protein [Jannaschia formosa]